MESFHLIILLCILLGYEMRFEFISRIYKYFLWISISLVLVLDSISLLYLFIGSEPVSLIVIIMAPLGFFLKLAILFVLIKKDGPIKILVSIWGGLMIVSGVFGYLAILTAPEVQPLQIYLNKTIILVFGLGLVLPISHSIKFETDA